MKLVPVLLVLCSVCSAKKIKKIKRLIVALGGIASLARGGSGGIGKSLQLVTQRFAASGQQYASSYTNNQPLVISTIISSLNTTTNTLHPLTSTSPITVDAPQPSVPNNGVTAHTLQPPASNLPVTINSVQPLASTTVGNAHQPQLLSLSAPAFVNQHVINTAISPAPSYALPLPKFAYGSVENQVTFPIDHSVPLIPTGLIDTAPAPFANPVSLAQSPVLVDPLLQSGWVAK